MFNPHSSLHSGYSYCTHFYKWGNRYGEVNQLTTVISLVCDGARIPSQVCGYRVCALHYPTTCLSSATTRKAKLQGLHPNGNCCSRLQSLSSLNCINWQQQWEFETKPWGFMRPFDFVKQSICHRLFSPTFKGKRSLHFRGFDHIFLETKKIDRNLCSFWSYAKVLPGRHWAWPPFNIQSWEDLYWGERKGYLADGCVWNSLVNSETGMGLHPRIL